jgi:DNA-binding IclR family transcriptional regulator
VKNRPTYSIDSVDHALRLAVLLRQEGPLRVSEVAERLGVARSTAHRLLAMLVYRDFAEQDADRRYRCGPQMRGPREAEAAGWLRTAARPHLEDLVRRTGETASLVVLAGHQVRFVATVQSEALLRVGDLEGRTLPAWLASGGRVLLAHLDEAELAEAVRAAPEVDLDVLRRGLRQVRRQGFAVNNQTTEPGITAVGRAVPGPQGPPVAAVCLAMPTVRYQRSRLAEWVGELAETCGRVERDLHAPGHAPRRRRVR